MPIRGRISGRIISSSPSALRMLSHISALVRPRTDLVKSGAGAAALLGCLLVSACLDSSRRLDAGGPLQFEGPGQLEGRPGHTLEGPLRLHGPGIRVRNLSVSGPVIASDVSDLLIEGLEAERLELVRGDGRIRSTTTATLSLRGFVLEGRAIRTGQLLASGSTLSLEASAWDRARVEHSSLAVRSSTTGPTEALEARIELESCRGAGLSLHHVEADIRKSHLRSEGEALRATGSTDLRVDASRVDAEGIGIAAYGPARVLVRTSSVRGGAWALFSPPSLPADVVLDETTVVGPRTQGQEGR